MMGAFAGFIMLAATGVAIWLIVLLVRAMFRATIAEVKEQKQRQAMQNSNDSDADELDGMNEGDYRNGPGGYTSGAYQDSFYGTIYDRELDDEEDDEHH